MCRLARICALVSVALATAGCASTVIDPSVTTEPAATTTTLPSGPASELLPRLLTEVGKLSDAIGTNDHKSEQMALIDNLWNAARPEVAGDDGVLALNVDGAIAVRRPEPDPAALARTAAPPELTARWVDRAARVARSVTSS